MQIDMAERPAAGCFLALARLGFNSDRREKNAIAFLMFLASNRDVASCCAGESYTTTANVATLADKPHLVPRMHAHLRPGVSKMKGDKKPLPRLHLCRNDRIDDRPHQQRVTLRRLSPRYRGITKPVSPDPFPTTPDSFLFHGGSETESPDTQS